MRKLRARPGGVWGSDGGDDGASYWKLDKMEDGARRRRRLRRNLAFDSHEEATQEARSADEARASLYALTSHPVGAGGAGSPGDPASGLAPVGCFKRAEQPL